MEIKRQIIESNTPPSNKEVWWFDVNTNTLKRYTRNKWSIFDTIPFDIPMPDAHTIVYICSWEMMDVTTEEIIDSFNPDLFGGIATCDLTSELIPSEDGENETEYYICRVTFNDPVTFTETAPPTVSELLANYVIIIKYPANIASIPSYGITIEGYAVPTIVLGENVKSISMCAIYSAESIGALVCLAQNPPVLDSSSIIMSNSGPVRGGTVYVPNEVVSLYERATNWSSFTIKPLSKYESLLILKQF